MPKGLNAWLDVLASRPLPVLSSTRAELNALMANKQLSVVQYDEPVLYDPGCAVRLLKTANSARIDAGRPPLTSMTNVMSHLGRGQLQLQLVRARYLDDLALPPRQHEGYLRYVAQACHAASQARDWAQTRGTHDPEEMQLAALLHNIGELALWCYGDDAMMQIEQLVYVKKQAWEKATEAVLGCSCRQLGAALAEAWTLSELSIDAMHSKYQGFTLATGVALASKLARLTAHSWYEAEARHCINSIAEYQGRAQGEVESRLHQNALALSQRFMHLGYRPPAALLPMLVDENYVDSAYIIETEPVAPAADSVPPPQPSVDASSGAGPQPVAASASPAGSHSPQKDPADSTDAHPLEPHVARLQALIRQGAGVQALIHQVVDSIAELGFDRAMFALKTPRYRMLLGQHYAQPEHVKALQNIKIPLDTPNLFSLLMEKMQPVRLREANRAGYWKRIPPKVQLMLGNDRFVAMSIFAGDHPLGLMYADRLKQDVSDEDYRKFQTLCRLLAKAVVAVRAAQQRAEGS